MNGPGRRPGAHAGPAPGEASTIDEPHVRASDVDRERVVAQLAEAATDGRLDLTEYADRAATAYQARTHSELAPLAADLGGPARELVPAGPVELTAVLGNESRKGRWLVPERLRLRSVLGDCHIELQEAVLQHRVTTIEATARFGSVTIFVPDGVRVQLSGRAVLGGISSQLHGDPGPSAPTLVVHGHVLCGTVTVRPPKPWARR